MGFMDSMDYETWRNTIAKCNKCGNLFHPTGDTNIVKVSDPYKPGTPVIWEHRHC